MKASGEAEGDGEKESILRTHSDDLVGWLDEVFMVLMLEFDAPVFLLIVCMSG